MKGIWNFYVIHALMVRPSIVFIFSHVSHATKSFHTFHLPLTSLKNCIHRCIRGWSFRAGAVRLTTFFLVDALTSQFFLTCRVASACGTFFIFPLRHAVRFHFSGLTRLYQGGRLLLSIFLWLYSCTITFNEF
jgi:hypothetical protein